MTTYAASRSPGARSDRPRLLWFAPLLALALFAAQGGFVAAAVPKGGGPPGGQGPAAAAQSPDEGIRQECQDPTDPARGKNEGWRSKHCPEEQVAGASPVEGTVSPEPTTTSEPQPTGGGKGNGKGNGKPKDEVASGSGSSSGDAAPSGIGGAGQGSDRRPGSGGKNGHSSPGGKGGAASAVSPVEESAASTADLSEPPSAPATAPTSVESRQASADSGRTARSGGTTAIVADPSSDLCGGVFSGRPPGSLAKSATRNGAPLADGGTILPGDTLVFSITWSTGDWVGSTLDKVADCVSINGSLVAGLSAGEKPTANDGAFTHTIVVPSLAGGTVLCDRARLSGQPAPGNESTQKSNLMCFTLGTGPPPPPGAIDLEVAKTNDANADGTFNDLETAPAVGSSVNFRAVISNNSAVPVVISSLTDIYFGVSAFTITCPGAGVGATIPAGGSVTCAFSVANYAPGAGETLVDTVTVVGNEVGNPSNTDTDSDDSTVMSPGAPPRPAAIDIEVVKTNDANADGTFNDAETTPAQGAAVTFRTVVTNESDVAVMVTALTDEYASVAAFTPACAGLSLLNLIIPAGGSVTCTFTVTGYAPPAGQSLVNTVRVTAVQVGNPSNSDAAQDTSTVTTPAPPAPGAIALTVQKTNDADEDGTFSDNEEALEEGAAVTFRAVITNTGSLPVQLSTLTDAYEGVAAFSVCAALIGTTLAPGQSVTCTFTLAGYAPTPNGALPDTVTVTAAQVGNPGNSTSASDTSTVTTPEVAPRVTVRGPSEEDKVLGAPGGLAATGAELAWLGLLAMALLASGGVIAIVTGRRGTTEPGS